MKPTITEDNIFEIELFEEDGSVLLAAENSWRGMAVPVGLCYEKEFGGHPFLPNIYPPLC